MAGVHGRGDLEGEVEELFEQVLARGEAVSVEGCGVEGGVGR